MDIHLNGKARTRANKPKLKTGCKTCRKRRVKCDETKPFCLRCVKFGGDGYCDGYAPVESPTAAKTLLFRGGDSKRKLVPIKARPSVQDVPTLPQHPYIQKFSNDDEFQAFSLYREEIAPRLSFLPDSVWHRLMLQAGDDQQLVRHGIIAIGALTKALELTGPNVIQILGDDLLPVPIQNSPRAKEISRCQEFALRHYDKFLNGLISYSAQATSHQNLRMALIGVLIIYCAENIQYRQDTAIKAALNGFKLVGEFISSSSQPNAQGLITSPKPSVLEDALIQQFRRMELHILVVTESQSTCSKDHLDLKSQDEMAVSLMPRVFTNIETAGLYLELIMRRSYHFVAFLFSERKVILDFQESDSQRSTTVDDHIPNFPEGVSKDSLQVEHEKYAAENRRWQQAFEPLLRREMRDMNTIEALRAILLKIQSISFAIRVAGAFSDTELVYDKFMKDFSQIVSWSTIIQNHPQADRFFGAGGFSCDIGIIYHILTTAMYCRDRRLRRQAISLLRKNSWREIQWGSSQSADVAVFLMEVEEEGVETDFIPEMARARLSGVDIFHKTRMARLHCIRGVGEHAVHSSSLRDWSKMPASN